jgi:uncharacterized protein (DUF2235 family)
LTAAESQQSGDARSSRNILIFSDGTGQAGGIYFDQNRSNIYKLYRATRVCPDARIDPAEQLAYYDAGLGSRPPGGGTLSTIYRWVHNFIAQATGFGLTTNIVDCYEMLVRLWRPGDRIFLFGFSRGAYTVRCIGGVLAHCGIPTRLGPGEPMKYVKRVYQHTASRPYGTATPRQRELLEQRQELARQFRDKYGVDLDTEKSNYPFFIGVFDTVAAVASTGALVLLLLAAAAVALLLGTVLWWLWRDLSWLAWTALAAGLIVGGSLLWYLKEATRFAPRANPAKWWRTFTVQLGRMRFEDRTLNENVRYARHTIAIDEDRASFDRVPWGGRGSTRPERDAQGVKTFQQYWFAGNHSDVGGSYAENESRLSDITLQWIVDAATRIQGGLKVDASLLHLHPSASGMQHDERKAGIPLLTRYFGLTWKRRLRVVPATSILHPSVIERAKLPAVLQHDAERPYRPEGLRLHVQLAHLYATPFKRGEAAGD